MTFEEIDAFLRLPWVGAIAVGDCEGGPRVVPVWYHWDGRSITIWSDPTFPWVRQLAIEPRVAFTAFEHDPPGRAVYASGTVSVARGTIGALREDIRRIASRYVAPVLLDETIGSYDRGGEKVLITLTPERLRGAVNLG